MDDEIERIYESLSESDKVVWLWLLVEFLDAKNRPKANHCPNDSESSS